MNPAQQNGSAAAESSTAHQAQQQLHNEAAETGVKGSCRNMIRQLEEDQHDPSMDSDADEFEDPDQHSNSDSEAGSDNSDLPLMLAPSWVPDHTFKVT